MNYHQKYLSSCLLVIAALLSAASFDAALAQTAPPLGSASTFAVLDGSAVTCTNATVIGDVGVVSTAFTNTGCTITGKVHAGDSVALQAYNDFLSGYATLAAEPCGTFLATLDISQTLPPGVYCFTAAAAATSKVLTLDGPSNGIWIFKIGTLGTGALTGTSFSVVMANGGVPCNVYWWVAQAVTLTDSNFQGTLLAGADITVTRGTFNGAALAGGAGTTTVPTGAVTLTGPGATVAGCATLTGAAGCEDREDHEPKHCNQGVGNGPEGCDPGNSDHNNSSNDELGGTPGNPGRKGGNR